MPNDSESDTGLDVMKGAFFDSLGHPLRIKILESLSVSPLSFSGLKKKVGIESSGHLTFHLDKLKEFLRVNTDGDYELTDDGKVWTYDTVLHPFLISGVMLWQLGDKTENTYIALNKGP